MAETVVKEADVLIAHRIQEDEQVFEKRLIKTGLSDGIKIEVLEGLSVDDKIKVPQS